jgi:peptide/nickel transport system substrate-binding protein
MSVKPAKLLLAGALAVLVALGITTIAAAQSDEEKVVLTVGVQGSVFDSMSPLVGQTAFDYDVWNNQYETVTRKAAADFETTPGLAESWEASNDGKTYTYKLRGGLKWSDGQPLTANDIAFTINRGREEEWLNYSSWVGNLTAKVIDDRTVEVTSSVPDPKLPGLGDVYILPEHVWGKLSADEISKYPGEDGVGSGPFVLDEFKRGQYVRLKSNPNYWEGQRPIDEVVFRIFNNPDAMVAALERGEIDAAHNVPSQAMERLSTADSIVPVEGNQGGFDEIAINGGDGLKKPHPALLDRNVRVAIAHAIDKQTLLDRVWLGLGSVEESVSPSADPAWVPEIPADELFEYDPEKANQILDDAGYEDTDGDGVREMPGGGEPLEFTYYVRSESEVAPPVAEFVSGWLKEIGIQVELKPISADELITVIGKGDYDMFHWSWTPYVDPDAQLSYFQCNQIASDPEDPTNYYNDANYCDPEYDKLYEQQKVELDKDKRLELVHEMLTRFHGSAVYQVLALTPDLQAYRTDRFAGWLHQPADVGPVIFSNTSPTYRNLTVAASSSGGGGGMSTGAIIGIVAVAIAGAALIFYFVRRRSTAEERE